MSHTEGGPDRNLDAAIDYKYKLEEALIVSGNHLKKAEEKYLQLEKLQSEIGRTAQSPDTQEAFDAYVGELGEKVKFDMGADQVNALIEAAKGMPEETRKYLMQLALINSERDEATEMIEEQYAETLPGINDIVKSGDPEVAAILEKPFGKRNTFERAKLALATARAEQEYFRGQYVEVCKVTEPEITQE